MTTRFRRKVCEQALICSAAVLLAAPALASSDPVAFDIAAQPLVPALRAFAEQSNMQLMYKHEAVENAQANTLVGSFDKHEALQKLLRGTGLEIVFTSDDVATIRMKRRDGAFSRTSMVSETPDAEMRMAQAEARAGQAAAPSSAQSAQVSSATASNRVGSELGNRIEEVIVTAQHRQERLYEVPMGITAITSDVMSKSQQRGFEDYTMLVPGMTLSQGDSGGVNTLSMRGLNANGVGSTVSVYLDEAPIGSSSAVANGSAFASNFDTWDMQRVEVLRGPQGMFYGASSEGGLVKFITNAPDPKGFDAAVEAGAESVAKGGTGWSAKGMLNVPLGERAAFRISGFNEHQPGYVDDLYQHKHDVNTSEKTGVRASFLVLPTDTVSVRLTAQHQVLDVDGGALVDADNLTRLPAYGELTHREALLVPSKYRYDNVALGINWDMGWASLMSSSAYSETKNGVGGDLSLMPTGMIPGVSYMDLLSTPAFYPPDGGLTPTGLIGATLVNKVTLKKFTQEFRLQSPEGRLEWELGAFFTREQAALNQPFQMRNVPSGTPFGPPGWFLLGELDSIYKEWAAFGSITYAFTDKFDVQLGGRWARNEQTASLYQSSVFFGIDGGLDGGAKANKFLYSLAPRWHINDRWMAYARVASGYQPGGMNLLPVGTPAGVPTQFKPDSTVNYELGTRAQLLDRRLAVELTAFRIDWTDVQLNQVVHTPIGDFGIVGNGGTARSQGVELSLQATPFDGLNLTLSGAYIDAILTSRAETAAADSGDRLPGTPRLSTTLDVEYAWPLWANYRAYVGGTWAYVGNVAPTFSTISGDDRLIDSYTYGNLRAGVQSDRWGVSLYAKNVTDRRALLSFGDSGDPAFAGSSAYNRPRTIGIAVTYRY